MVSAANYYGGANPDLLYRIPSNAKCVVEIGCGSGGLGEAYKRINPETIYIGLELVTEQACEAEKKLDYVLKGDVNELDMALITSHTDRVDCLVLGDVLEHLVDPESTLIKLIEILDINGTVLACIPNVQHWSTLINLLNGEWPQNDQGLFDRTHLRWFTKKSILELMNKCNLVTQGIYPRIFDIEKAKLVYDAIKPALNNLKLSGQDVFNGIAPLQYVIKATKKSVENVAISGLMMRPQAGMNEVRMLQPLRNLGSLPGVEVDLKCEQIELKGINYKGAKIMIWQRQLLTYKDSLDNLKKAIDAGYILISEFDDNPAHWPEIAKNKNLNFTAMHGVQVSTEILANKISKSNPQIKVFENCLEQLPAVDKNKWERNDSSPMRIFFGALNRKNDWEPWIKSINEINREFEDKIEYEVIHDYDFFEALENKNRKFTPTCDYKKYMDILKSCHIALLPLNNTEFNKCKSDLKFVESAGCEVAAIASNTVYSKSVEDGITGRLCESGEHLYEIMSDWLNNQEIPKEIAMNARTWCKKERLQYIQSEERLKWYLHLWNNREQLTADIRARVPELK